jgi:hypothetical protein
MLIMAESSLSSFRVSRQRFIGRASLPGESRYESLAKGRLAGRLALPTASPYRYATSVHGEFQDEDDQFSIELLSSFHPSPPFHSSILPSHQP